MYVGHNLDDLMGSELRVKGASRKVTKVCSQFWESAEHRADRIVGYNKAE